MKPLFTRFITCRAFRTSLKAALAINFLLRLMCQFSTMFFSLMKLLKICVQSAHHMAIYVVTKWSCEHATVLTLSKKQWKVSFATCLKLMPTWMTLVALAMCGMTIFIVYVATCNVCKTIILMSTHPNVIGVFRKLISLDIG